MRRITYVSAAVLLVSLSLLIMAWAQPGTGQGDGTGGGLGQRVGKKRASFVTVLDFGAIGDGVADDAPAIQALIEAKAGTIRFPAGTYRLKQPLIVDLDKVGFVSLVADGTARLVMSGSGPAVRFVGTHGGTAAPDSVASDVWDRQRMPAVEGLAIVGDHPTADGIEATGTMQLTIRGVHIRNVRHGIHLVQRNRNVLIDACHIYENSGCGIFLNNVNLHQTNISACHISYCGGGGVVVHGGEVRNVHINGCDIEANMAKDGPPSANVLFDCADGSMAEAAITGCTIQHTKDAPESANIRILGRGFMVRKGAREPFNCGHVTIGDNVLSDVQTNIHLVGARGVTITGNTFWQGYTHNLLVEDSLQVVVGANMLERNPLYGYTSEASNKVVFRGCKDCTIQGLHLHDVRDAEAGITFDKCDRIHFTGNSILDCGGLALLIKDTTRSRFFGNMYRDDRPDSQPGKKLVEIHGGSQLTTDN